MVKDILLGGMVLAVAVSLAQVRESRFKGWNSYELKNQFITLHITPQLGGRIISYALGDHNFLWSNDTLVGKVPPASGLTADGSWLNWGGDKLWPAPQGWDQPDQWPGPPDAVLDGSPYGIEVLGRSLGKAAVELTSREDERSGIRLSRVVQLYDGGTHVGVTATMTNVDTKPRRWGIWTVTQLNAENAARSGGWNQRFHTYAPLTSGYRVLFGEHDNPEFQEDREHKLLCIHYQRKVGKVGLRSTAGWLANVDGAAGYVFVQEFTHEPAAEYPDDATVEVWTQGLGTIRAWGREVTMKDDPVENPNVVESELLGPLTALAPGDKTQFHYDWYAANIGGDYPVLSCNRVGCVCETLRARTYGRILALTGRFGVFVRGHVQVEFYDKQHRVLPEASSSSARIPVSPMHPVVFPGKRYAVASPAVPKGAVSVALMVHDSQNACMGKLAHTTIER